MYALETDYVIRDRKTKDQIRIGPFRDDWELIEIRMTTSDGIESEVLLDEDTLPLVIKALTHYLNDSKARRKTEETGK